MAWVWQSPGIYKWIKAGDPQVIQHSPTKPTNPPSQAAGGGGGQQLWQQTQLTPALQAIHDDLQNQINMGWITQEQMDAELNHQIQLAGPPNIPMGTPGDVYHASQNYTVPQAVTSGTIQNPDQFNPFGSQTTTIDPTTGKPTVTQQLSQGQQQVVGGMEESAQQALNAIMQMLGGGMFGGVTGQAEMSSYEQALFDKLTKDMETNKAKDMEMLQQQLAQRGIPVGSELYNNQIKELNQRYDTMHADAKNQSVLQGNQMALSSLPVLQGLGSGGFFSPQYSGFQGMNYQPINFQDLFTQLQGNQTALQIANIQKPKPSAPAPSPFNMSAPPGYKG